MDIEFTKDKNFRRMVGKTFDGEIVATWRVGQRGYTDTNGSIEFRPAGASRYAIGRQAIRFEWDASTKDKERVVREAIESFDVAQAIERERQALAVRADNFEKAARKAASDLSRFNSTFGYTRETFAKDGE